MTWNYRVVRRQDPTDMAEQFGIHEVYYDTAGRIEAWTEEPCAPFGESLAELIADTQFMAEALSKPVLEESTLIQDSARRAHHRHSRTGAEEEGTDTTAE